MKFTNEKITDFSALSDEERTAAFAAMSNDALSAALSEQQAEAKTLFTLDNPTITQVDEAEALVASIAKIEEEQASRDAAVADAAKRFAAARQVFAVNDGVETGEGEGDGDATDAEGEGEDAGDDADDAEGEDAGDAAEGDGEGEGDGGDAVTTASGVNHTKSQTVKVSAARRVGAKTKRPQVQKSSPVTITAAADVPGYSTGSELGDLDTVTKALLNRAKGFPKFSERSARAVQSQTGSVEQIHKFGVASFGLDFDPALTASKSSDDYSAYTTAIKQHQEALTASINAAMNGQDPTLRAAGWCAPSENVYSWVADFVVDGLVSVAQVSAPRGGLNVTTGPAHVTQGDAALDAFGFVQTEAQAIAGTVKTCETIECPDFTEERLDAIGYCYKIPLLTKAAYPELITDALRLADVLYAHKMNRRRILKMVDLSDVRAFSGYGASFTDALEALAVLAVKERRKWNIGENAILEVKVPVWAREVFRADMSRRTGLALTDVATDQKINAEFAARRLAVEYIADWQELTGENVVLPGGFQVMIYPSGTFAEAVEDVINLSAVYDAASLSVNEFTGVFFEQGHMLFKAAYGSSILTIPVNTAGETGAAVMTGQGDATSGGSF